MAKLTGWLTIDRLNGGGNAIVTLDASAFTELGERNASLKIKTSSRDVIVNINQKHYEEPLIPDNIPNNQIWVKSTDGTVMSFYSSIKFEYDLIETELRTDGWTIFTFAGDITYIPQSTFQSKEKLQEVVIPKSITSIGVNAFNKCYSLESIAIPDSVISIGANAFNYCWELKTIYIGSGLAEIPERLLKDCTNLEILSVSPNNTVFDSRENCNCLIRTATNSLIKGTTNSFIPNTVVEIYSFAFWSVGISSIVIPNSVKYIQNYAFQESDLTTVTIGSNVTYIGMAAFGRCPLKLITTYTMTAPTFGEHPFDLISKNGLLLYPSGTEKANSRWLSSGSGFLGEREWVGAAIPTSGGGKITCTYNVTNTSSETKICDVDNCKYIKNMTIDGVSVTPIDVYAFDSTGEHTIVFDLYLPTISEDAFRNCESLTSITISNNVTEIGDYAFHNCYNLTSINLGKSVTKIGYSAFGDCESLSAITIPDSVTSIDNWAFGGCSSLSSITCNAIVAPTISAFTFDTVASNGVLKYPSGSDYSSWLITVEPYLGYYGWTGVPF